MWTPGSSSSISPEWGMAQNFQSHNLIVPCSVAAQSLPCSASIKGVVAELYHCLLGERPLWLCSWQPKDALLDCRPCTAEPICAQGGRTGLSLLTTWLHSPKVRISPLMHLPATPELCSAENTKRPQCLLNDHLLS